MTDLAPDLKRALHHVDTDMDADRTDTVWIGLGRKRRNRVIRRTAGAAALVMLVGGVVFYRGGVSNGSYAADRAVPSVPQPEHKPPAIDDGSIKLADGSTILPDGNSTKIEVVKDVVTSIAVVVDQGKGKFKVGARTDRTFKVTTSNVRISVYAAEFSVAHVDHKTKVYVERGYLDIEYKTADGKKVRRVNSGESAEFPETKVVVVDPPDVQKPAVKTVPRSRAARRLAVSDLLKKADAARVAQNPNQALKPLTRVVREFSSDPRAAMASFTLGRIYLKQLSRPSAAARAFRRVQALAPGGPLAEDALAREVESWAAAGQSARAKVRATVYLKRYPNGHRARAMKKYTE